MIFVLWLISVLIFAMLLYWIITSAINNSNLANDIKEIKELLQNQMQTPSTRINETAIEEASNEKKDDRRVLENCPACGASVWSTDVECKTCGLRLIFDDENVGDP